MMENDDIKREIESQIYHRLMEEITAAERRHRDLVENLQEAVFRLNTEGHLVFLNHAWAANLGHSIEGSLEKPLDDFLHPEDRQRVLAMIAATRSAVMVQQHKEIRLYHKSGGTVWFELSLGSDPQGGVFGLLYNITARKDIERELHLARDAALNAARFKTQFLANMSHEIRTPMNGILGALELLSNIPDPEQHREYIDIAHRSAQSLLSLLNDILDLSKIEAGCLTLETVDFNLGRLVDDVISLFTLSAQAKGLRLTSDIGRNVPSYIRGEPTRLRQVLSNLLGNAIKFTEHGSVSLAITVDSAQPSGSGNEVILSISVSDTGIGIPKEHQTQIFDAFAQADASTTRRYGGTGLGLAICKRLVEAMGGRLAVESTPGTGSRFSFDLRTINASPPQPAAVNLPNVLDRRHKVLVVEDNAVNLKVAVAMLTKLGCANLDIAENGRQAVDAVLTQKYDLVLMDCQMPVLDGYEAARQIRAAEGSERHTTIVALTAGCLADQRRECLESGMDDFICKPVRLEQLSEVIRRWL
ncbi:MAG: ATP-binding protein [Pseudomonadota bacterium]